MTRIAFWEAVDDLAPRGAEWDKLAAGVAAIAPDILVTNELPFGPWIAACPKYCDTAAEESIRFHMKGIVALSTLKTKSIITSRPIAGSPLLINEAIIIRGGMIVPLHRKQFLPAEEDFYETTWYRVSAEGFRCGRVDDIRVGALLCTELMFSEWARHYRHCGCHIIAVPRSTGCAHGIWKTAAAMAAIVSGCYVISSNRVSHGRVAGDFGGCGFAFGPGGELLAETSPENPVGFIDIDVDMVLRAQANYPCYVSELASPSNNDGDFRYKS